MGTADTSDGSIYSLPEDSGSDGGIGIRFRGQGMVGLSDYKTESMILDISWHLFRRMQRFFPVKGYLCRFQKSVGPY